MKKIFIGLTLCFFYISQAYAQEPDFFVTFSACKITVSYLVPSDKSLKVLDGDPSSMGCYRDSNKILCSYTFEGSKQVKTVGYDIILDSPPLLYFLTSTGAEFVAIDTSKHAAAIITRIVGKQSVGSKVCNGLYATTFEIKLMDKK